MKKHITVTAIVFLAGLFVLPMTALGRGRKNIDYPGRMMVKMAPQVQVETPALTAEQVGRIEAIQKKLQDENTDAMKQLTAKIQNEIMTDIQKEIDDLNANWGRS